MAYLLDRELRARFNLCISRESCGEIIDAVISGAAAGATEFLPPAVPPVRPLDGGCISPGVASAVALSSSAALAPARTSDGGRTPSGDAPAVTWRASAISRRFLPDLERRWMPTIDGEIKTGGELPFSGFATRREAIAAAEQLINSQRSEDQR